MFVMSNAFFSQAEITQSDRWKHGPLELHLVPEPKKNRHAFGGLVVQWNQDQCGGVARDARVLKQLQRRRIINGTNPNQVVAPTLYGYSELLGMLGSLLPTSALKRLGIKRPRSTFWLWPLVAGMDFRSPSKLERLSPEVLSRLTEQHLRHLACTIPPAFERWVWTRLMRSARFGMDNYAENSSLRLLAGDTRFWMHRLYRIAIDLYESFPPVEDDDPDWTPLNRIQKKFQAYVPDEDRSSFQVTRPRMGGHLWYANDSKDREWITNLLLTGDATAASLDPIVEVLRGSAAHEDFSQRYSWVKEDFERAFYSKRSKLRVSLYECLDDCPVHDGCDTPGYEEILFRDLMAFFDRRDQHIILALRQGKTKSNIAAELGHNGHAAISRRVHIIQKKVMRLLKS
jgi:hypothetical protein